MEKKVLKDQQNAGTDELQEGDSIKNLEGQTMVRTLHWPENLEGQSMLRKVYRPENLEG